MSNRISIKHQSNLRTKGTDTLIGDYSFLDYQLYPNTSHIHPHMYG